MKPCSVSYRTRLNSCSRRNTNWDLLPTARGVLHHFRRLAQAPLQIKRVFLRVWLMYRVRSHGPVGVQNYLMENLNTSTCDSRKELMSLPAEKILQPSHHLLRLTVKRVVFLFKRSIWSRFFLSLIAHSLKACDTLCLFFLIRRLASCNSGSSSSMPSSVNLASVWIFVSSLSIALESRSMSLNNAGL
jgi:hypothetical protein